MVISVISRSVKKKEQAKLPHYHDKCGEVSSVDISASVSHIQESFQMVLSTKSLEPKSVTKWQLCELFAGYYSDKDIGQTKFMIIPEPELDHHYRHPWSPAPS